MEVYWEMLVSLRTLHGFTSQKIVIFIITAVRFSHMYDGDRLSCQFLTEGAHTTLCHQPRTWSRRTCLCGCSCIVFNGKTFRRFIAISALLSFLISFLISPMYATCLRSSSCLVLSFRQYREQQNYEELHNRICWSLCYVCTSRSKNVFVSTMQVEPGLECGLQDQGMLVRLPQGKEEFFVSKTSRPSSGPTKSPI